jgi:electron-transferring-flavoprotein dehydrogenase
VHRSTPVKGDVFHYMLSPTSAAKVPNLFMPQDDAQRRQLHHQPRQPLPLAGQQAEGARRRDLPGFAAAEVLYNEDGRVKGIATGDMGIGKDGEHKDSYTPGMELHAKYTIFAEGCRGHLGKQLIERASASTRARPQHYGIGIKELWEIDPAKHRSGAGDPHAGLAAAAERR